MESQTLQKIIDKNGMVFYSPKILSQDEIMQIYKNDQEISVPEINTSSKIIEEITIKKFDNQKFCELIKQKEYKNLISQIQDNEILYSKSFLDSLNDDKNYEARFKFFGHRLDTFNDIFFLNFGFFHPNNIRERNFTFLSDDFENIKKILIDEFKIINIYEDESKSSNWKTFTGLLNSSIIKLWGNESGNKHYIGNKVNVTIYYHYKEKNLYETLFDLFEKSTLKILCDEASVYLLKLTRSGELILNEFAIKNKHTDIKLNYNNDFEDIDRRCKDIINNSDHGLIFLHSKDAGTGKSSYLYYLCDYFKNKRKIIYVPSNMLHLMDDSKFHDLLTENPRSVIVMEDCENVILAREINKNGMVQTLLNYTDGFLAEIFEPIFICTFNADVSKIDKALLRKGRCLLKYDFNKLEIPKAQNLSDKLGFNTIINEPMTLTDVYNQEQEFYSEEKRTKIGY